MLFKIRYIDKDGHAISRQGNDLLSLSSLCDGTIVAIYSWVDTHAYLMGVRIGQGWKVIYSFRELSYLSCG